MARVLATPAGKAAAAGIGLLGLGGLAGAAAGISGRFGPAAQTAADFPAFGSNGNGAGPGGYLLSPTDPGPVSNLGPADGGGLPGGIVQPINVPEPSSVIVFIAAVAMLALVRWWRRRA